jgi:hypothetical protein
MRAVPPPPGMQQPQMQMQMQQPQSAPMPPPQVQAVPEGAPPAQGFASPMGGMQR